MRVSLLSFRQTCSVNKLTNALEFWFWAQILKCTWSSFSHLSSGYKWSSLVFQKKGNSLNFRNEICVSQSSQRNVRYHSYKGWGRANKLTIMWRNLSQKVLVEFLKSFTLQELKKNSEKMFLILSKTSKGFMKILTS